MQHSHNYSNWVEVDLGAIEANVRYLREHTGAGVMAVVKANGYGHGALPVAQAALRGGATWCGVARIDEALALRQAGLDCPLLVMGYIPPGKLEDAVAAQVSIAVWDPAQLQLISMAAQHLGLRARVQLKVDTGMSRLGIQAPDALDLAQQIAASKAMDFEAVFTHFARADEGDPGPTDAQERLFRQVLQALEAKGIRPPLVHAANSAASLVRSSTSFNLVRAGISIYGLHPSDQCPLPAAFQPALTWKAVLSQVKVLPAGRGVSYGHTYTTRQAERIGTVPVGYADGLRRVPGNQVLVGGKRVPVVGRVCMDQISVQLDAVPEAQPGDEVVLIGAQDGAGLTAEDVGQIWGTINYEVVCAIGLRVPRLYFSGGG